MRSRQGPLRRDGQMATENKTTGRRTPRTKPSGRGIIKCRGDKRCPRNPTRALLSYSEVGGRPGKSHRGIGKLEGKKKQRWGGPRGGGKFEESSHKKEILALGLKGRGM